MVSKIVYCCLSLLYRILNFWKLFFEICDLFLEVFFEINKFNSVNLCKCLNLFNF